MQSNSFIWKGSVFWLGIWKNCLTIRLLRQGNRLPRAVVDTPSLEICKTSLDNHWSGMTEELHSYIHVGRDLEVLPRYDSLLLA